MNHYPLEKQNIYGPGLRIELDPGQCFPADPGAGEPAVIVCGRHSATFHCAANEGWALDCGDYQPTPNQCLWLAHVEPAVSNWLSRAWAAAKEKASK